MKSLLASLSILTLLLWSCQPDELAPSKALHGPLSFEKDSLQEQYFCRGTEACVTVDLRFLRLQDDHPQAQNIQRSLDSILVGNNGYREHEAENYAQVAQEFIDAYQAVKAEQPDMPGAWEMLQDVSIFLNNERLFGLQSQHYNYSGAAHGNTYIQSHLYRISDGHRMQLKDLITAGSLPRLTQLADSLFRAERALFQGQKLNDFGYWFDQGFYLPEVFFYTDEGLTFVFNLYEIAPYSEGIQYFKIPYPLCEPHLREEYQLTSKE